MKREYLKQVKEAIRDFKDNREFLNSKIDKIEQRYNEKIEEAKVDYAWDEYFMKQRIETLKKEKSNAIYKTCEDYGNDASIHIIYEDGSECCTTGTEIVACECTPKMQHIAYATYEDGYTEYDTETGELNYDVSIDEQEEAREEYFNNIEVKFQTEWGKRHMAM